MRTAMGSHLSREKAEGEGDRPQGPQRDEQRGVQATQGTGRPLLQRTESASDLPGEQRYHARGRRQTSRH